MHPDLIKLLDLQGKDIELLQVDRRLQQLDAEVAELDIHLNKEREHLVAAQRSIDLEARRRDELEGKIDAHRKHQEKRREKLEFMKTQKEVAGLMAEIDLAKGSLSAEENEWIKASDQVTQMEMRKAEAEQRVQGIEKEQAEARSAIAEKRQALHVERKEISGRREVSARDVRKPLLQLYEKLRASSSARTEVVVALSGPACGACFTTVPVNRRSQIKSGNVIEPCENCGVILYFAE
jgi:predicted  nucleic acid-binding Zn-ribbon protein